MYVYLDITQVAAWPIQNALLITQAFVTVLSLVWTNVMCEEGHHGYNQ